MEGLPIALSEGGWILVVVAMVLFAGLVIGFFTRRGSGIEQHPRGRKRGGTAPGSHGPGETSGRDEGERTELGQHGTKP